jgi:hypothetical protein
MKASSQSLCWARRFTLSLLFVAGSACSRSTTPKLVPYPNLNNEQNLTFSVGDAVEVIQPRVDILFVIDDSSSMEVHQKNLSSNIDQFNGSLAISSLDYHIAVLSSSLGRRIDQVTHVSSGGAEFVGPSPYVITPQTPDGLKILSKKMRLGNVGSGVEKFFYPVLKGLSEPLISTVNRDFLRTNAYLAIVFVTDTDDQSLWGDVDPGGGAAEINPDEALARLLNIKNNNKKQILSYGAIVTSQSGCHQDQIYSYKLSLFINSVGGKYFSLCDPNFGQRLSQLGKDLANQVGRYLILNRYPILSTIRVEYDGQPVPSDPAYGWSYDAQKNAIIIGDNFLLNTSQAASFSVKFKIRPTQDKIIAGETPQ